MSFRILDGTATLEDLMKERRRDALAIDAILKRSSPDYIVIKSPDGQKWKVTVDNTGTISTEAV